MTELREYTRRVVVDHLVQLMLEARRRAEEGAEAARRRAEERQEVLVDLLHWMVEHDQEVDEFWEEFDNDVAME
jgi:lactate dehydrogenase-like 2-hydroxyacid dehydrogenase